MADLFRPSWTVPVAGLFRPCWSSGDESPRHGPTVRSLTEEARKQRRAAV